MSSFWSAWIIVLTLPVLIGCAILLTWNLKNYVGVPEDQTTGHEVDGISEINNPLPRWWTYMFVLTLVWSVFYLAAYPGLGNFKGFLGWTSSNQGVKSLAESKAAIEAQKAAGTPSQLDREYMKADETFAKEFAKYTSRPIEELAYDTQALKVGQRLFLQNCAQCHGSDARGQRGFPNLTDNDWLYGGTVDKIKETLLYGRKAAMPAWGDMLGDDGVKNVAAYVRHDIAKLPLPADSTADLAAGQAAFNTTCVACHGAQGHGTEAMGAPNLTDRIWLYGSSFAQVQQTLRYGRNGKMPAQEDFLGNDKVHLLAAYVYSLSQAKLEK